MVASVTFGTALILITAFVGIAFAAFQMMLVSKVTIEDSPSRAEGTYFFCFCFVLNFSHISFTHFHTFNLYYRSIPPSLHTHILTTKHKQHKTPTDVESKSDEALVSSSGKKDALVEMVRIYKLIQAGAKAFLFAEYALCAIFIVLFGALVLVATAHKNKDASVDGKEWDFKFGGLTAFSFVVGSVTSIISGYIGMMVAVYANVRTWL